MSDHHAQQLERLTFFSDAVFAIAITLLVIEIHVPHLPGGGDQAYLQALYGLLPHLFGFVLSFLVIGALWASHHRVFGMLQGHDDGLVWPNLLFLLSIAFMPFATALMSGDVNGRVPALFYAASLLLAGLLQRWLFTRALRAPRVRPQVEPAEIAAARWRTLALPCAALAALLVAWTAPPLSYLCYALIPFLTRLLAAQGRRRARRRQAVAA
ncbi:TMEM175 family protein [Fulvimonas soli]|jgi:uncharacterized membrane protein|uniref:Putative membrane protein n=1 Tax=Fulvimonas soli TaxID=155197 RepID=A0A316I5J3_9GAMM|nr:TMEM175 family protein [Fulvimonas soli]PWK87710.1 putative membrane protein [Fulvimonas soli]TNY27939.1 hypothetical protein BV497_00740 [Fulvimonas soli]